MVFLVSLRRSFNEKLFELALNSVSSFKTWSYILRNKKGINIPIHPVTVLSCPGKLEAMPSKFAVFHGVYHSMQKIPMKKGYRSSPSHPKHSLPPMERKYNSLQKDAGRKTRQKLKGIIVLWTEKDTCITSAFFTIGSQILVLFIDYSAYPFSSTYLECCNEATHTHVTYKAIYFRKQW